MKRLHDLKATEVSLVPQGANKKRFLITKSADTLDKDQMVSQVRNTSPSLMERVKNVLKSFAGKPDEEEPGQELSPAAQTALKATARILAPHKDEITDGHLDAIQQEIGIDGGGSEDESEEDDGDGDVKPEHAQKAADGAMEAAQKAYKEQMAKLGYQKYPEPEFTMKSKKKDDMEEDEEEDEDEGEPVNKTNEVPVKILKEDGSVNLDAVPAEMRPFAEVIMKQNAEAKAAVIAADARAANSEKVLKEHTESVRKAEIIRKTAEFPHLKADDVQKTLEMADKAGREEFDRVVKMFEAQNKALGESAIFKEIGSGQSSASNDAMGKIEAAVATIVLKSSEKITKEQAMASYLETPEGQALYAEHQKSRKDGI